MGNQTLSTNNKIDNKKKKSKIMLTFPSKILKKFN